MSRKLRIEYPAAIYHVMNRGDQREDIFRDDEDRQEFLSTLGGNDFMSADTASRLRRLLKNEAKLAYVRLNNQTPCPPRGTVPVNQGRTWEAISFCSFRIALGHGCDYPGYVRSFLAEGRAFEKRGLHGVEWVNLGSGGQFQALFDGRK